MIKAGKLDRRLIIQRMVDSIGSDYGDVTESPMQDEIVWASIRHLRGRELYEAQQINAEITTEFMIRYRDTITPKHQGICEGRVYDFIHVAEDTERGRRAVTRILAAARNA